MRYELVVIWETGEKEVHKYNSLGDAKDAENGFRMVFGNQISWTGIKHQIT